MITPTVRVLCASPDLPTLQHVMSCHVISQIKSDELRLVERNDGVCKLEDDVAAILDHELLNHEHFRCVRAIHCHAQAELR